jgi:hypothetical protein
MKSAALDGQIIGMFLLIFASASVLLWSYCRYLVVKRHGGLWKFAFPGGAGFIVVDWKSKDIPEAFVRDWKRIVYPAHIILLTILAICIPLIAALFRFS